jgi:beta-lactamase regulating signal transducer with metallopeptidase domain
VGRLVLVYVAIALAAIGGCLAPPPSVAHDVAHALILALTLGLLSLLAACLYQAGRHERLARGMARLAYRGTLAGQPVQILPGLTVPFVAGLWTPRIFSGNDLSARLDEEELGAVMLHERHHLRDRAPLRLVGLSALASVLGRMVLGRVWLEREQARIEIAADAYALAEGVSRPALASALLKLSTGPALAWAPGLASAAELRVRALLGEPTGLNVDRRFRWAIPAIFLVAACLLVYLI